MRHDVSTPRNGGKDRTDDDGALTRAPVLRGERARERVLRAALAVLADEGMPGFSLENVAHRAGASKATIYRRWASRGALLVDAMALVSQQFAVPATGHLRSDLIELLSGAEAMLEGHPFPQLLAAFVDAAERDPSLAQLQVRLTERGREPLRQVLSASIERGEIAPDIDVELVIDLLAGPLFYRRFIAHQVFPPGFGTAIVDQVLTAIGHLKADPGKTVR